MSLAAIRIGTRGSDLALWQARHVAGRLRAAWPDLRVEIVQVRTRGDRDTTRPIDALGGKGVFVREIETRLLDGEVDLAVHSLKDLPARLPEGLVLLPTLRRAPVEDALVGRNGAVPVSPQAMPPGAVVGTGSLRRTALLRRYVPQVEPRAIRGNVPTRIGKVDAGELDAVVLARAGLVRLGVSPARYRVLPADPFCPAPCQGLLGLEARAGDRDVADRVAAVACEASDVVRRAERAFLERLGADCTVPLGGLVRAEPGGRLTGRAFVALPDGTDAVAVAIEAGTPAPGPERFGTQLAESLLRAGGRRVFERLERASGRGQSRRISRRP